MIIVIKQLLILLSLIIMFNGCADPLLMNRRIYIDTRPSPFEDPLFTDYETYKTALQELNDIDSMNDNELEDLLFNDDYRIHPEFLPHIDHYKRLKEFFTGKSTIRSNIKFVMADLENIATEADFIKFKTILRLEGTSGECRWQVLDSGMPLRLITIDYTFWNLNFPLQRRETIFHELGHCDLDRKDEPKHTFSLMAKNRLSNYTTRFYQELFDPEKINNYEQINRFKRYEESYFSNNE